MTRNVNKLLGNLKIKFEPRMFTFSPSPITGRGKSVAFPSPWVPHLLAGRRLSRRLLSL